MSIENIIYNFRSFSEKDLIPFSKATNRDFTRYDIAPSKEFFIQSHPSLSFEHLFICKNIHLGYLVYYDFPYFLSMTVQHAFLDKMNPDTEDIEILIDEHKALVDDYLAKHDYKNWLFLLPSGTSFIFLKKLLDSGATSTRLFDTFLLLYSLQNFDFSYMNEKSLNQLAKLRSKKQLKYLKDVLQDFPSQITVYRGENKYSTPLGFSWTPDHATAIKYACINGNHHSKIITGIVDKKDIIAYVTDSTTTEQTFLLSSKKIRELDINNQIDMLQFQDDYIQSPIFSIFKELIPYLHHFHCKQSQSHIKRVMLLASYICYFDNIPMTSTKNILFAVLFHELGKTSEEIDANHGLDPISEQHSDEILDEYVLHAISAHDLGDEISYPSFSKLERTIGEESRPIYDVLCDANALDSIRFGLGAFDISLLRRQTSKRLIATAIDMFLSID